MTASTRANDLQYSDVSRTALSELIARLEQASGPDRELDGAIVVALNLAPADYEQQTAYNRDWLWLRQLHEYQEDAFDAWEAPRFSESIDAALTLAPGPETGWWSIEVMCSPTSPMRKGGIYVAHAAFWGSGGTKTYSGRGDTAALSLCIAALRARLAHDGSPSTDERTTGTEPLVQSKATGAA